MDGHELAMGLRKAYLAIHRETDALVSHLGITADQFVVLSVLAQHGPMTQRDVVDQTSSDPSTVRAMLVLLERKKYVSRKPHPTDARARLVSATASGRTILRKASTASQSVRDRILNELGDSAAGRLNKLLDKVCRAVNASTAGETPGRRC